MHICAPIFERQGKRLRVEVPFRMEAEELRETEYRLWYEVPVEYGDYIDANRLDFAVVALLILAMRFEENIHASGQVSPRLMFGLRDYQHVFSSWSPYLSSVEVTCDDRVAVGPHQQPGATGSFFSGGVDSFYSLWSHHPQNESIKAYQTSHVIYIEGFDSFLERPAAYEQSLETYGEVMDELGVALVPVRTNLKRFIHAGLWRPAFGTFLVSTVHLFSHLFDQFYVPSSNTYSDFHAVPEGANPLTDHLLSTESTEIIHDGATVSRREKVEALAEWPMTYDHLYVCFVREGRDMMNCCQCEKCLRTMIALELTGKLERYSTFPEPLTRKRLRRWRMPNYHISKYWAKGMLEYAKAEGRGELSNDLRWVIWNHEIRNSQLGKLCRKLLVEPLKRVDFIRNWYYRLRENSH